MKEPQQLQILPQEQIQETRQQARQLLESITKNQLTSIKSMILPPMFTFNILKLVYMMQYPQLSDECMTWMTIKKQLLVSPQVLTRRCEMISLDELGEDDIARIETAFQDVLGSLGTNIEGKAELYGALVFKIVKFCLRMRTVMYGSRFLRAQD